MDPVLHGIDQAHQLLGCMRDGYIVVLALITFLGEIGSKGRIPKANVFGSIVDCVEDIAAVLGISRAGAYTLMRSKGFPTIYVGKRRMIVMRDKFISWLDEQAS